MPALLVWGRPPSGSKFEQDHVILAKLLVKAGTKDMPVGTPMAILVEEAEHVAAFKNYQAGQSSSKSQHESDAKA
ncbi:hypothetical protein WJX74_001504 [Apatococcus lobatus]|uniref:Uncharacterized protein n=1 Tax=Apatococcus lobatus TaxID=904363 RepID=A0AAW1S9N6_9CHLO